MKIFCIGRNYVDHAKELNNPVPSEPLVFMKPPTALLRANKPFYHPDFSDDIHYEIEIVIRIDKNGKCVNEKFAEGYYSSIALGIDFTARDIQKKCKEKGHPWEKAKGFDNSAVLSEFYPLDKSKPVKFSLEKNGETVQVGNSDDMIFGFGHIVFYLSKFFTLQQGDIIYTGTPAGVGKIEIGDILEGYLGDDKVFRTEVK